MKHLLKLLSSLALFFCLCTTSVMAEHRVIIKLTGEMSVAQLGVMRALSGQLYTLHRTFEHLPYLAVEVSDEGLESLIDSGAEVFDDIPFYPTLQQSIPLIGADTVHAKGITGRGWSVAIIDTGVETSHPAFSGRIVGEACFTKAQCPNGLDKQIGTGAGVPCTGSVNCAHGTHVAGIAAGSGIILGVAPQAGIVAVNVFTVNNSGTSAFTSDIMAGIEWVASEAVNMNIAALNLSLGGELNDSVCDSTNKGLFDAAELARKAGVAVVAASGNGKSDVGVATPACISNYMAIGCTSEHDVPCTFSNDGMLMELYAPGLNIRSAGTGGFVRTASGTSMSTPHVAGAYVLARQVFPAMTNPDHFRGIFKTSGTLVNTRTGRAVPRLQIDAALAGAPPPPPPPSGCADIDSDGEQDNRDRCPQTPLGATIDDAGCSKKQFCNSIQVTTWRSKGVCRKSDWGNDEPIRARDCKVQHNGWGVRTTCVPR